jgi:hypothetical protein
MASISAGRCSNTVASARSDLLCRETSIIAMIALSVDEISAVDGLWCFQAKPENCSLELFFRYLISHYKVSTLICFSSEPGVCGLILHFIL